MKLQEYFASLKLEPFFSYDESTTRSLFINYMIMKAQNEDSNLTHLGNEIVSKILTPSRLMVNTWYEPINSSIFKNEESFFYIDKKILLLSLLLSIISYILYIILIEIIN